MDIFPLEWLHLNQTVPGSILDSNSYSHTKYMPKNVEPSSLNIGISSIKLMPITDGSRTTIS